jgi:flagellar protein FliO/FliZ
MFESLFAPEMPLAIQFCLAFLIVLGLIGATAWAVSRFGKWRLAGGASSHGHQSRLSIVQSGIVDGRRRLILIRRDNVEHLLLIGGPNDLVIEPNSAQAVVAPHGVLVTHSPASAEPLPRTVPLLDKESPALLPASATMPRPAPRIEPFSEEPAAPRTQTQADTSTRLQRDMLEALVHELSTRPPLPRESPPIVTRTHPIEPRPKLRPEFQPESRRELRPEPRVEPQPEPPMETPQPVEAETAAQTTPTLDENLADMARRLEMALRKPSAEAAGRPSITLARAASPPQRIHAPSPLRLREPIPQRADAKPSRSKTPNDGFEQELASLLGRQPKD